MTVLQAQGLGQSFGEVDLFAGVTVSVAPDARIGLVGPNGVGKTTLLRILAGQMSASAGRFDLARGARIGYLTQESAHAFGAGQRDIQAEMLSVFEPLRAEEARLAELEASISRGEGGDEAVERYGDLQARFELAGGYDYPIRIRRTLTGLGFEESSWGQPVAQLSGGQKTRLQLARLLLESPDLLILDEPTNHLDIEAVEWLEGTLGGWPGALLVVSHDRYFLDRVANTIWEMFGGGIETYRGNYSAYVGQRAERWALRQRAYEEMKAHFEKELDYIRRNIASMLVHQGDYDAAFVELDTLLTKSPNDPQANLLLGIARYQSGDPALAVEPLEVASKAGSADAGMWLLKALCIDGVSDQSVGALQHLIESHPERAATLIEIELEEPGSPLQVFRDHPAVTKLLS